MSYENAPATKLVATHCVACGRPLVDAQSIEAGMGPDCRGMYGAPETLTPEARADVNARVHRLATATLTGAEIAAELVMIRALGADVTADKLESRFVVAEIAPAGDLLSVVTPFDMSFVSDLKDSVAGRRWDAAKKQWLIPATRDAKNALWAVLRRHFAGGVARGPDGVLFQITALVAVAVGGAS